jgi:hypothetical protein
MNRIKINLKNGEGTSIEGVVAAGVHHHRLRLY